MYIYVYVYAYLCVYMYVCLYIATSGNVTRRINHLRVKNLFIFPAFLSQDVVVLSNVPFLFRKGDRRSSLRGNFLVRDTPVMSVRVRGCL